MTSTQETSNQRQPAVHIVPKGTTVYVITNNEDIGEAAVYSSWDNDFDCLLHTDDGGQSACTYMMGFSAFLTHKEASSSLLSRITARIQKLDEDRQLQERRCDEVEAVYAAWEAAEAEKAEEEHNWYNDYGNSDSICVMSASNVCTITIDDLGGGGDITISRPDVLRRIAKNIEEAADRIESKT